VPFVEEILNIAPELLPTYANPFELAIHSAVSPFGTARPTEANEASVCEKCQFPQSYKSKNPCRTYQASLQNVIEFLRQR
jgi:hypothetical protein